MMLPCCRQSLLARQLQQSLLNGDGNADFRLALWEKGYHFSEAGGIRKAGLLRSEGTGVADGAAALHPPSRDLNGEGIHWVSVAC